MTNRSNRISCSLLIAVAVAVIGLIPAVSLAADPHSFPPVIGNAGPGVLPVKSSPYGMTYGQWSARWWQWAFSLPIDRSPLFGTADCSAGQSGLVWFLPG